DIAYFTPPPLPDDQNFLMTPLLRPLFDYKYDPRIGELVYRDRNPAVKKISVYVEEPQSEDENAKRRNQGFANYVYESSKKKPTSIEAAMPFDKGGWQTGVFRDLKKWQTYYRIALPSITHPQDPAEDVLASLGRFDDTYLKLREDAKTHPLSRFPRPYTLKLEEAVGDIAYESRMQEIVRVVALRAVAELRLNHPDEALADLQFGFRLVEAIKSETLLMPNLIAGSLVAVLTQPVWEGIAAHRWNDAQLDTIQAMFQKLDRLSDWNHCLHSELAWTAVKNDNIAAYPGYLAYPHVYSRLADEAALCLLVLVKFTPGLVCQNQIAVCRTIYDKILPLVDAKSQRIDMARLATEQEAANTGNRFRPYIILSKMAVPVYLTVLKKDAQSQTYINQIVIACAIERYYLVHYALPATLDDLHMANLPHDIINGQPLHYRATGTDNYILYSVGWNGTDEGGKIGKTESGSLDL
ncbi:MAG: hypothetical protein WCD79_10860, partial [Chthoniobacteraceae bacterium]